MIPSTIRRTTTALAEPTAADDFEVGPYRLEVTDTSSLDDDMNERGVDWRPGLSVADEQVDEGAGAAVKFAVRLARAASQTVTVDYATADGNGACRGGLHGGERLADVRGGRVVEDGRGRGARRRARRGGGDVHAVAVEPVRGVAGGRRGRRGRS